MRMSGEGTAFVRYEFKLPHEMAGPSSMHPVVVVGAGPIGLTLALTLSKAGVDCVLLEDDGRVCDGSRAIGMSRRTLEIWDSLEAIEEIKGKGLDWSGGRSFYRDREILNFKMADDPSLLYRPMFNIQQSYTEQFLVNKVMQSSGIDLRWHSRLVGLEEASDGVTLQIDTPKGIYPSKASFVVACDGAKSSVRALSGLNLKGTSYEATYMIVDIKLKTDAIIERRCWFDSPSNPGLTVLMHGQPDGVWRLDFQLAEGEDVNEALRLENVNQKIQSHLNFIGETGPWELVWSSPYKVHSRSLDSFTHGRVMFAGDAAHLMPIFGIRGLNSGVEDAWNLAWKLADVIQARSPQKILDAYSFERKRVFVENTALANRNAMFMTPPNAGIRVLRDAVLSLALGKTQVGDILNPKQATYVPLRESPLCTPEIDQWDSGPRVGEVLPDVILHNGPMAQGNLPTHLQKIVGIKPVGLYFLTHRPSQNESIELKRLQQKLDFELVLIAQTPLEIPDFQVLVQPDLFAQFNAEQGGFYLIRADHHVVARWRVFNPDHVQLAMQTMRGYTLQGKSLDQIEAIDVPYTASEQIYQLLGNALDGVGDDQKTLMLMKLCLSQSLERASVEDFKNHLATALKDLDGF